MKNNQILISILMCLVNYAHSQITLNVSQSMAVQTIQSLYSGQSVDLYIGEANRPMGNDTIIGPVGPLVPFGNLINGYNPGINIPPADWLIYVDTSPMRNGEHSSSCYWISKTITLENGVLDTISYLKASFGIPSGYEMSPAVVVNRYGTNANMKPMLNGQTTPDSVSSHTHVIILNGENNKYQSYERSWNDCSYIYQVLTKKCGVPKQNIHSLCRNTYIKADGSAFTTASVDMDMDNMDDGNQVPNYQLFSQTVMSMCSSLTQDDHLFIFITGKSCDGPNGPSIKLKGNTDLSASLLNNALSLFNVKDINVVLSVNNASAIANYIQGPGRIVTAACSDGESVRSCDSIPFDEFAYQWTSAVNQADLVSGNPIDSDTNGDGIVSMAEAFHYANGHSHSDMHPVLYNGTLDLAEKRGFTAPSYDLFIRDNAADTGDEPNLTTNDYTHSPDITMTGIFGAGTEWCFSDSPWPHILAYSTFDCEITVSKRGNNSYIGNSFLALYWRCPDAEGDTIKWHLNVFNDNTLPNGYATIPAISNNQTIVHTTFYDEDLFRFIYRDTNHQTFYTVYLMAVIVDNLDNLPLTIENEDLPAIAAISNNIAIGEFTISWDVATGIRNMRIASLRVVPSYGINVTLSDAVREDAQLLVTPVTGQADSYQTIVPRNHKEILCPISTRQKGVYAVTLVDKGKAVDSKRIVIE